MRAGDPRVPRAHHLPAARWRVLGRGSSGAAYGKFLDVIARIPYLRDLGVNAIQLLPIQEYDGSFGLGYAGLDYFSPEMVYRVEDQTELAVHLDAINTLLAERGPVGTGAGRPRNRAEPAQVPDRHAT